MDGSVMMFSGLRILSLSFGFENCLMWLVLCFVWASNSGTTLGIKEIWIQFVFFG